MDIVRDIATLIARLERRVAESSSETVEQEGVPSTPLPSVAWFSYVPIAPLVRGVCEEANPRDTIGSTVIKDNMQ